MAELAPRARTGLQVHVHHVADPERPQIVDAAHDDDDIRRARAAVFSLLRNQD